MPNHQNSLPGFEIPNQDSLEEQSGASQANKRPSIGIGIDYGTSNSAAAIFDGTKVHLVQLERHSVIMPSATYIDKDFKISTGQGAINHYIESNTGRTVELSAEILGESRTTTGQIGDKGLPEEGNTQTLYGQSFVDGGQQGRLFRGIKRLLGSTDSPRLMVFERAFRLVALITPLLLRIRKSIELQIPEEVSASAATDHACIGHPVNFEGSAENRNRAALDMLSEAYGYAEFVNQSYYPEPIAAALSYLHENQEHSAQSQVLLAVDFGGGTLDLCVIRREQSDFEVIATHGIGLGGDHIDQVMFKELLFPLLGRGERWKRAGEDREIETLFPFEEYEDLLLNWAISYMLNQNKFTTPLMKRISVGDEASIKFQRLYDMIKSNYSYLVFQCIKELKAELSEADSAKLDIPELDIEFELSREQFELMIGDLLDKFSQSISDLLQRVELESSDIDLVIRTGGSSLIPAVKRILEARFPGKVIEHDPFTSVAAGLAIADYEGLGEQLVQE
ncbi:MAG: hypothetical protein COB20_03870 [SAR86 cluster bacterium]|uniref:Hsp70 family protein n=1 Tax=SAR86 cluster bacterium TaxID=2030880 RepID=A0A2A4XCC7_9GAMM|nr:MAG: hypothetical protein COB20_03870 [SAR86 cluster bacterium]